MWWYVLIVTKHISNFNCNHITLHQSKMSKSISEAKRKSIVQQHAGFAWFNFKTGVSDCFGSLFLVGFCSFGCWCNSNHCIVFFYVSLFLDFNFVSGFKQTISNSSWHQQSRIWFLASIIVRWLFHCSTTCKLDHR